MKPIYLFLDLETSGLDPNKCSILEAAAIIRDPEWTLGPTPAPVLNAVVRYTSRQMDAIHWDPEAYVMHCTAGPNGPLLDQRVGMLLSKGPELLLAEMEDILLGVISPYPERTVILAGNTISLDMSFLKVHMPRLAAALHYRLMDVSVLVNFFEDVLGVPRVKQTAHRALPDVMNSLRLYEMYAANTAHAFHLECCTWEQMAGSRQ